MNLCLRTNGRKKCAEIAEQAITVLSSLLTHPNHEVYFYSIEKIILQNIFRLDPTSIHLYILF
jgi:hypothetical protein